MTNPRFLAFLYAGLVVGPLAMGGPASAQQAAADRQDAALAYAQCIRDHGYAEFPDPDPEGGFKFLIEKGSAPRFKAAADACRDLAPEGMRDRELTPQQMDALVKLAQCVRENGVPQFPDPGPAGNFDLGDAGIAPGDTRLDAAMAACRDNTGQGVRITIGG